MKRLLLFAALLAWSGMASAVVYKWVDAQGKVQYGDRPPDGVKAEVVELLISHNNASAPHAAASATSADGKPAPADASEKAKVAQDVQQTRDKQCADAQDRYKKLIESRRLYKEGANGERQYLTSDQIDQERLNAKREIDETCNGGAS
ncbi:MAG TPA: DUF4124 domain-containing protein [Steroidobacteraceae bacterium]|jgi:hypothetical protein